MTASMVSSGIGVVLCRLFAVMLFVQAASGVGQVIDISGNVYGKWLLVWVGVFEILIPAVAECRFLDYAQTDNTNNMGNPMNFKRLSIGTVVGAIVLYVLGYVIWVWLFADFFGANSGSAMGVDRDAPVQWALIVGALLYALMLTLALEQRSESASIVDGVKVGVVVGLLLWGTADFTIFAVTNIQNLNATIADTLLEGVHGGITGGIVAAVLGAVGK